MSANGDNKERLSCLVEAIDAVPVTGDDVFVVCYASCNDGPRLPVLFGSLVKHPFAFWDVHFVGCECIGHQEPDPEYGRSIRYDRDGNLFPGWKLISARPQAAIVTRSFWDASFRGTQPVDNKELIRSDPDDFKRTFHPLFGIPEVSCRALFSAYEHLAEVVRCGEHPDILLHASARIMMGHIHMERTYNEVIKLVIRSPKRQLLWAKRHDQVRFRLLSLDLFGLGTSTDPHTILVADYLAPCFDQPSVSNENDIGSTERKVATTSVSRISTGSYANHQPGAACTSFMSYLSSASSQSCPFVASHALLPLVSGSRRVWNLCEC